MARMIRTHKVVGGEHKGKLCRVLDRLDPDQPSNPGRGRVWIELPSGEIVNVATGQLRRRRK